MLTILIRFVVAFQMLISTPAVLVGVCKLFMRVLAIDDDCERSLNEIQNKKQKKIETRGFCYSALLNTLCSPEKLKKAKTL